MQRRSASSIQTSIRLVVATSLYSSQTPCTSRRKDVSRLLSSPSSASMSCGVTKSASLSAMRCRRWIWPIERSVLPPTLRARSAMASVVAEDLVALVVEHQVIVAKVRARHVPVEVLGLSGRARTCRPASRHSAAAISRVASLPRSVGV